MIAIGWIIVSFLTGVLRSLNALYQKHAINPHDSLEFGFGTTAYAAILTSPLLVYVITTGEFHASPTVWTTIIASGVLNGLGISAIMIAFKYEDVSLVSVLASLNAFFTVLVEPLVFPGNYHLNIVLGGILATIGVIILSSDGKTLSSVKQTATTVGPLFAFATSVFFTGAGLLDRFTTQEFSPLALVVLLNGIAAITIIAVIAIYRTDYHATRDVLLDYRTAVNGLLRGLTVLGFVFAYSISPSAAQVIIVVQISLILNVVAGNAIFNESHLKPRLIGTGFIVGAIIISTQL